jgi:hypothetical protein
MPGSVLKDHTGRGGPDDRQASAGSVVPTPPRKPMRVWVPLVGMDATGVRATLGVPAKVAKVR